MGDPENSPQGQGRSVRILHRYILKELVKAFGLALAAITGVVSLGMVLKALQDEGIGPVTSLLYVGLSIPGAAYIALGLAAVLATTLVYGRLAADNEVMACQASGVPVSSLLWPTVLLAVVTAATNLFLAVWPLPESGYAVKRLSLADVERLFFTRLSSTGKIKVRDAGFEMSVDRVEGNRLSGPALKYRGSEGQTYAYAPYGLVEFDRKRHSVSLFLSDAQVIQENGRVENRGTHIVGLTLPTEVPRDIKNLSLWRLLAAQQHPERFSEVLKDLKEGESSPEAIQREKDKVRARALAEMHGRLAAAVGCFGLVLLGAGLGVLFHSGHLLTAFGVALAPWLGAFLMSLAGQKAVSAEIENPQDVIYLIWSPNLLMALLAVCLLGYLAWGWTSPTRLRDLVRKRGG
jgi:lipopolysaccharide export system permease protein